MRKYIVILLLLIIVVGCTVTMMTIKESPGARIEHVIVSKDTTSIIGTNIEKTEQYE
jgi:hypothetical protein